MPIMPITTNATARIRVISHFVRFSPLHITIKNAPIAKSPTTNWKIEIIRLRLLFIITPKNFFKTDYSTKIENLKVDCLRSHNRNKIIAFFFTNCYHILHSEYKAMIKVDN